MSARQELYNLAPWHVGLDEDDLHVSLNEMNIPPQAPKFTVTLAHDPMKHLRGIIKTHKCFYIFPTNDKRDPPPLHLPSRKWSQALKQVFADLKREDDQKAYTGWITMEPWERHTKAKNHLLFAAGPLIDLRWAVDKVVCEHGTKPLVPTRAFSLKQGYTPERPLVSIHINTARQPSDPIDHCDLDSRGLSFDAALRAINVPKPISSVDITFRFDVHQNILSKYYNDRYLEDLGNGKKPPAVTERSFTDVRGFQKFLNRQFEPQQEDISLNSKEVVYPLGGGVTFRAPHEKYLRFEWSLPTQRGERLLEKILSHQWSKVGDIFVVKVKDLEEGHLYQMQASREMLASHPKMDGPETWSVLNRGPRGRSPYMYNKGMSVPSKISVFANLDVSGYPCDNGRNPVQRFAWNAFHNDGIVLFYGPEASLVRFWNTAATTKTKTTEAQCKPITPSTWAQPPVATSFEVRTPASERALHAQVVAGPFGPYKNWRRAADPNFVGNAYRAEYVHAHSSILAHKFAMLGTVIVSAHPNCIKRNELLKAEDQSLTEQNRAVMAGTKLGSTDFISAIIAEDEQLMAPPVSTHEKLDLLNVPSPQDMPPSVCLDGVLLRSAAMDTDQEKELIAFIDSIEGWDTSTPRRLWHYGYSHEHGGKNVQRTDPILDSLRAVMENCQDLLRVNDIVSVLNQCTVADYPPSVGVIDHVENFLLGKVVVMVNLLSTVPMQFTPTEPTGGDRVDILLERWSIVAITGRARYKYQHGISAREYDIIRGENIRRERRVSLIFRSVRDVCNEEL